MTKLTYNAYTFVERSQICGFFDGKMDKERRRPPIDQRLRKLASNGRAPSKKDVIDHELGNCGLLDENGHLGRVIDMDILAHKSIIDDPAREVTEEVGISIDILEAFAEEQTKVPLTNGHALLDDQFPSYNPDSPRSIISDDYSEDSRP